MEPKPEKKGRWGASRGGEVGVKKIWEGGKGWGGYVGRVHNFLTPSLLGWPAPIPLFPLSWSDLPPPHAI
eukprot:scaffold12360_cov109-Isochrysis_galbana.AAC.13